MLVRPATSSLLGNQKQRRAATYSVMAMLLLGAMLSAMIDPSHKLTLPQQAASLPDLGKLPLYFEPNVGQSDPSARYITRTPGGNLYFTPSEVALSLGSSAVGENSSEADALQADAPHSGSIVHMQFIGSNADVQLERGSSLPARINYFLGNDPAKWHTDVPTYSDIAYTGLYPGVDLSYEGMGGQLKGTYTLAAGVSPSPISWRYAGASDVKVDDAGNLLITLDDGRRTTGPNPVSSSKRPSLGKR